MTTFRSRALSGLIAGLLVAGLAGAASAQSSSPAATTGGLDGTDWLLASVGGSPVASGVNANLLFTTAEAGGFGGCNRFFTSYTSDGVSTLTFGAIASTKMACDEATDAFEQSYLTALGTVASYAVTADGLSLADSGSTVVLTFAATAPASVEGPWNVTNVNNGNQGVEAVPEGIGASVAFGPDGNVEGFGGCNSFSGGYSVNGDAIAIGPLMSTMMSCGEATDAFEVQFLTALQAATVWSVSAGTLDLRDATGAQQVEATTAIGH